MMGRKKFNMKQHHNLCLDDFIKPGNIYRKIDETIDFQFIYDLAKDIYSCTGQPSLDPVVFFKIELVGFLEGIHEDRALERRLNDSFAIRWFLGYDLDELLPMHSTISRTRKDRITKELYEAVFDHILSLCVHHQLVNGSHQSIDSTLLEANSSLRSLQALQPKVREHYQKLTDSDSEAPQPEDPSKSPENPSPPLEPSASRPVNRDLEAKVTRKPGFFPGAYYKATASSDGKCGIITHAQVDHANQNDMQLLPSLVSQTRKRLRHLNLNLNSLAVDSGYYSAQNLKLAEEEKLTLYIRPNLQTQDNGLFRRINFQYDALHDQFICPEGKTLRFRGYGRPSHMKKYQAQVQDCQICPQKLHCTRGQVKVIQRSIHEDLIQAALQRVQSPEGKAAMRLRQIQAEGTFAQLKSVLKFTKYYCLGLENAKKKFLMACSTINLKKLLQAMDLSLHTFWRILTQELATFKELSGSRSISALYLC